MSENKKVPAKRLLRLQSLRVDNTRFSSADTADENQKKINFPVKKRNDTNLDKKRKEAEPSSTTELKRSPAKRQIQGHACFTASSISIAKLYHFPFPVKVKQRHPSNAYKPATAVQINENSGTLNINNNIDDVSPSKRLRNLQDNCTTRLPLSPRKDFEVTSSFRSPLKCTTPTRLATDSHAHADRRTPSKLSTPSQPAVVSIADDCVLTEGRVLRTPSRRSLLSSPVSNMKLRTPSQSGASGAAVVPSPSRSTKRNLASCFGGIESRQDQSNENLVSDKLLQSGICSSAVSLKLARESGACYQSTKQVLHTSLPSDNLIGRTAESKVVGDFFSKHMSEKTSASLYVSGAPGTGKTAVLSKAIEDLKVGNHKKCQFVYINCMTMKNANEIYRGILSSLRGKEVHLSAKSSSAEIENHFAHSKTMTLLVLDEMDSLDSKNQEVLYTIFEWPSLPNSKLLLVGIANSLDLTDRILPRLNARSWCRPKLLHFAPYSREELAAIINHRLSQVPSGETMIDSVAVQMCARKISAIAGDARAAIEVCRRAVEAVETDCRQQLRLQAITNTKSPSKRAPTFRKVGLKDILKVVGEATGGWSRAGAQSDRSLTLPLQHTVAICTLLLLLSNKNNKVITKEVTLGKFHEAFCRVCKHHGIGVVEQSEFLTLCELVESRGIFALKKAKDTRAIKVCLKMDEQELEQILHDKTLMSAILKKGLP